MRYLFIPLAIGTIGLGCVGFVFRDFALQWQPVPTHFPFRQHFALVSALLLTITGFLLWPARTRVAAAIALAIIYAAWTLLLHLPRVAAAPTNVATWLGLCEIGSLAAGAAAIAGEVTGSRALLLAARRVLGVCAIVFGLSHFIYADFTAGMVPEWIPLPMFWAYATGAGHALAGLSLVSGIRSKIASWTLASMCGAFVLLLHLPRVASSPASHVEWTMTFIALSIAGAALATSAAPERKL